MPRTGDGHQSLGSTAYRSRTAFVTGASSGIGEATARLLASGGARVALVARRRDLLSRIAADLPGSVALAADVSDDEAVVEAIEKAEAAIGPIDLLVNSAGVAVPTQLDELTPEVWRRTLAVNLSGTYYSSRELGLRMRARDGGDIVNVASDLAFTGASGYADYCASKAGIVGLTKALAAELAPTVRVNAVAPGPVDTPMMDQELESSGDAKAARAQLIARVPLHRIAGAEEVAAAIAFLASAATYTTGSVFGIDGGVTAVSRLNADAH